MAIDTAQPGDNINVAAGNYVENVNINKGLTLKGFGNPTATSITLNAVLGTGSGGITAPVVNVNPIARIQDGVKFASSGGTVNVAAGTYRENVDIQKSLDIRGAGAGNTIVDGQQANSVFTIGNQINSQVKVGLSDLTIRNGTGTSTIVLSEVPNFNPELGGGVLNFADLTITSATISGNTAAAGGGVFNYRGIVNLEKSIITGNKAIAGAGITSYYGYVNMNGGSIDHNDAAMVRDLNPYLDDLDRIAGSENIKLADDIVAKLNQAGVPIVRNNITAGGGIASYKSTVNLNGGSIEHNSAIIGGGIASYGSALNLKEGTIAQNNAAIGGGVAAILGVTNQSGGSIAYNEAAIGGGIAAYGDVVNLNGGSISSNTAMTGGGAAALLQPYQLERQLYIRQRGNRSTSNTTSTGIRRRHLELQWHSKPDKRIYRQQYGPLWRRNLQPSGSGKRKCRSSCMTTFPTRYCHKTNSRALNWALETAPFYFS